jgi:hypothetical protein
VTDAELLDKQGVPTEPVDGALGDCPPILLHLARAPADEADEAGEETRKCATWSDVPAEFRRVHYLRDD